MYQEKMLTELSLPFCPCHFPFNSVMFLFFDFIVKEFSLCKGEFLNRGKRCTIREKSYMIHTST
jgi:hypothetical protein